MKQVNFTIQFEEEKLKAAKFYAEKKDASVEDEAADFLQKLYEKYVPKDTREYLETALGQPAAKPKLKPAKPASKKPEHPVVAATPPIVPAAQED
jgi:hypothetical protein